MSDNEGGGKKSGYRLEIAPSARAQCKGPKPCKGTKIGKGELRLGSIVDFRGNTSFAWRHWGCTTERIIKNMKTTFEDPSELDGFDELPEAYQEKIKKAYEVGHVDEEDVPESAKKPEGESGEEDEGSGKKKGGKKTGGAGAKKRARDEDGEEEKDDEKPKKAAPRKRVKKTDVEVVEEEKPKKAAPRKRVTKKDEEASDETKEKTATKRGRPHTLKKAATKAKAKKADADESGEDFGDEINKVSGDEEKGEDEKKTKKPASKAKATKPASKAKPESKVKPASKAKPTSKKPASVKAKKSKTIEENVEESD